MTQPFAQLLVYVLILNNNLSTTHMNCGVIVNGKGTHGLNCIFSAGRFFRHATVNEILRRILTTDRIPNILKPFEICGINEKRPDGITLILQPVMGLHLC